MALVIAEKLQIVTQAVINFSGSGDNIIATGTAGKITRILEIFFVIGGTTVLTFKSGATPISGGMSFNTSGAMFMDYIHMSLDCLNAGDNFIINSTAAVQIGGTIWYVQQ
jgi:hypothetical protein